MTKKRPAYSTEFKNEAASLVIDKNYSVSEACNSMGVGYTAVRHWVKQLESERDGNTPTAGAITVEQQKIQHLEARIKQIEWEKDILKTATALLMSDTIRR
jgi:transposase